MAKSPKGTRLKALASAPLIRVRSGVQVTDGPPFTQTGSGSPSKASIPPTTLPTGQSWTQLGQLISVKEAAKILGVSPKTVTRHCERGIMVAVVKPYGNKKTYLIPQIILSPNFINSKQRDPNPSQPRQAKQRDNTPASFAEYKPFLKTWRKAMRAGEISQRAYSELTVKKYRTHAKAYLKKYGSISIEGIRQFVLYDVPPENHATRNERRKALVSLIKHLIIIDQIEEDFLEVLNKKVVIPKRKGEPKRSKATPEEIEALYKACLSPQDTFIITLLIQTGLRASEACDLRRSDISCKEGRLTVQCGKGGKPRTLGINRKFKRDFKAYYKPLRPRHPEGYILLDTKGNKMDRHGLRHRLERLSRDAGIATITPHMMRRGFVTIKAQEGKPMPLLQRACGHSSINTTMKYCQITENECVDAMKGW